MRPMRWMTIVLAIAAVVALVWAWLFGPYWLDYYKMQDIAGSATLSWAAFDENRGHMELADGLKKREIPAYLTPEACSFYTEAGGVKTVDCAWAVEVVIPVVEHRRRMSFRVKKSASTDGRLIQ